MPTNWGSRPGSAREERLSTYGIFTQGGLQGRSWPTRPVRDTQPVVQLTHGARQILLLMLIICYYYDKRFVVCMCLFIFCVCLFCCPASLMPGSTPHRSFSRSSISTRLTSSTAIWSPRISSLIRKATLRFAATFSAFTRQHDRQYDPSFWSQAFSWAWLYLLTILTSLNVD